MALPDTAIRMVLTHEGGYCNDPDDSGGATCMGVTQRDYVNWLGDSNSNVKNITHSEATLYYLEVWWNKGCYSSLLEQSVADRYFDLSVNMGTHQATKCLQRAVNVLYDAGLTVDGICGPKTVKTCNDCEPGLLLPALQAQAETVYEEIVVRHPERAKFKNGWISRLYN